MMDAEDDNPDEGDIGQVVNTVVSDLLDRPKRCFIEDGHIVFREGAGYDIPLAKLNSYDKILAWQLQLSSKQWMTLDLLMQFTIIACDYHRLPIARI